MKRHLKFFLIWGALALFGFFSAGQIWYEATFESAEHGSRLATTGLDSWPFVSSILWLSVAGILAVAFTSGFTRTLILWALTVMNGLQGGLFLVQGSFNKTPPGLSDEIEKHTGLNVEGSELAHDLAVSTQISLWPVLFFIALIVMFAVTLWAAFASTKWSKQDKQSRFEPGSRKTPSNDKASDDPIDLWDSQR